MDSPATVLGSIGETMHLDGSPRGILTNHRGSMKGSMSCIMVMYASNAIMPVVQDQ